MAKKIKKKGVSRSGGGGMAGGAGGGGLMSQFQKMQADMVKAQEELANESVDVTVGGGAITITITGHQHIEAVKIDKDSLDLEDEEWLDDLQELLVVAFNQAVEQSQALSAERMEGITGGLGGMLPPGFEGLI